MGLNFMAKAKAKSSENWGMGLFLVFFREDDDHINGVGSSKNSSTTTNLLMPPTPTTRASSSSSSVKRTNSSILFTKAQSTISICALFVFLTLLLFTLSTFEPSNIPTTSLHTPRRFLSDQPNSHHHNHRFSFFNNILKTTPYRNDLSKSSIALQGMGTLYRRGTKAMPDFVVAHLTEDVKEDEFRSFLRLLHRSGLTAKADVAFLFGTPSIFDSLIREENDSFLKLVQRYKELNSTMRTNSALRFNLTQFVKAVKSNKEVEEPLWGKRIRQNYSNSASTVLEKGNVQGGELTRVIYGSIVGFEVSELDPENSLAGFLDHVPMSLRRWACYPMLLGRVRKNFKHIALVDIKHLLFVGDPLGRVRSQSPESVLISLKSPEKHGKRNSDKTQPLHSVNSAIIRGGARGVRRLSNAMLTEIVRETMQHKKKSLVTESGVLSQLVGNEHILKNIKWIISTESIPGASSLSGSSSKGAENYGLIQRGGNHDGDYSIIIKKICSFQEDSFVYNNC